MDISKEKRALPTIWKSGEECFAWWIGDDFNQICFDDISILNGICPNSEARLL